jgi:D-alanyl-D-alanine carboxypeptidase
LSYSFSCYFDLSNFIGEMAHDVFISHAAHEKPFADRICSKLESRGISCWIAPRDIRPGMSWGSAIIEAIDGARVMLLVFSSQANQSPQVSREVERAVSKGLVVVPVRVEDVKPSGDLEYFLGTPHWFEAVTSPFDRHLDGIADSIKFWLERIKGESGSLDTATVTASREPSPPFGSPSDPRIRRKPAKWQKRTSGALVAVAATSTAVFFGAHHYLAQPGKALGKETEHEAAAQTMESISVPMPEVLDKIGERVAAQNRAPGFAFLVQCEGKALFSRGYGLANIEDKIAITPDTRFAIGSISKQFAAASILLLKQQGKLSLDDKLSTWLPHLPNANKITLRMLLYHISGLHNFPSTNEHEWPTKGIVIPGRIFAILATDKPDFEPGIRYAYSNTDYAALAEVVSGVSGKSYSEFLRTNIFAPLNMSDSGNGYEAQEVGIAVPYRGIGSFARQDGWSLDLYYGAGSIVSTVLDLAKWDQALLSGSLLDSASKHDLWTPGTLADGEPVPYGMGFVPATLDGHLEVQHNGYVPFAGGYCLNAIFPNDRLAIVVLSNGSIEDFGGQPERIVREVFESLLLTDDPSVSSLAKKIFNQVRQGEIDTTLLTENMSEGFHSQMPTVMNNFAALGDLEELVFQGRRSSENGMTKYTYRGSFAAGEHQIEISINSDGKVDRYYIEP